MPGNPSLRRALRALAAREESGKGRFVFLRLGASVSSVGLIEGLAEATASLLKTYSGFWSDRIQRRKPFIWMGYLFAALAKPITGFAGSWTQVLFARAFDRTGKGIRTAPRDAMLAESVPSHLRGKAFGWHRAMDTLGAAVGPLLAILFLKYSTDLRWIYYLAFIPSVFAVIVALGLKEKRSQVSQTAPKVAWASFFSLPKNFKYYLFTWSVFSVANSSDVFLLLRVQQSGVTLTETILMYCFYNLTYALMSPYLGGLSDKMGRKKILLLGLMVFCFVYGGFVFATSSIQFWALFGIYGLYMAATDGVGKALAIDLLDKDKKATAIGYLGTVTGISTLIASGAAGILWDKFGAAAAFEYGLAGALLSFVLLSFLRVP